MKSMLFLAALTLTTTSAFARFCEVEMVDNRTNRVIDAFLDRDDDCAEAMRECKTQIRLRGLTRGAADCHLRPLTERRRPRPDHRPDTRPMPLPDRTPTPMPYPTPRIEDARRPVRAGEAVIFNSQNVTVVGTSFSGLVSVRSEYGFITSNIPRENIAVIDGCNINVCVNESVILINSSQEVRIAGLGYNDTYVARSEYGFLTSNIAYNNIARTSGCLTMGYNQICVGNQVVDRYNQYKRVVAIQPNGLVVLRSEYGFINTNVDPMNLVIVR